MPDLGDYGGWCDGGKTGICNVERLFTQQKRAPLP